MNVIEILWKLGWDVLSFNGEGEYKIQFSNERISRYHEKIENEDFDFDGDLEEIYTVKVSEVTFNDYGDLFVSFEDTKTGEIVDEYEYKNMDNDELY